MPMLCTWDWLVVAPPLEAQYRRWNVIWNSDIFGVISKLQLCRKRWYFFSYTNQHFALSSCIHLELFLPLCLVLIQACGYYNVRRLIIDKHDLHPLHWWLCTPPNSSSPGSFVSMQKNCREKGWEVTARLTKIPIKTLTFDEGKLMKLQQDLPTYDDKLTNTSIPTDGTLLRWSRDCCLVNAIP